MGRARGYRILCGGLETGVRDRVRYLSDDASAVIDQLGLRTNNAEAIEEGMPHPTTFLLDREGVVRFVDAREDFHIWLDPELLRSVLASLP